MRGPIAGKCRVPLKIEVIMRSSTVHVSIPSSYQLGIATGLTADPYCLGILPALGTAIMADYYNPTTIMVRARGRTTFMIGVREEPDHGSLVDVMSLQEVRGK